MNSSAIRGTHPCTGHSPLAFATTCQNSRQLASTSLPGRQCRRQLISLTSLLHQPTSFRHEAIARIPLGTHRSPRRAGCRTKCSPGDQASASTNAAAGQQGISNEDVNNRTANISDGHVIPTQQGSATHAQVLTAASSTAGPSVQQQAARQEARPAGQAGDASGTPSTSAAMPAAGAAAAGGAQQRLRVGGPGVGLPLVDEFCGIVCNGVLWTGQLAVDALRRPLQPRGAALLEHRLAAHMDPANAERCACPLLSWFGSW